jgi:gp16 family phage-associated protein
MNAGLSKAKRLRSLKEVRAAFNREGKSVTGWAREHGFTPALVFMVLGGKRPCLRGQSHRIAVKLGIKDGVIAD